MGDYFIKVNRDSIQGLTFSDFFALHCKPTQQTENNDEYRYHFCLILHRFCFDMKEDCEWDFSWLLAFPFLGRQEETSTKSTMQNFVDSFYVFHVNINDVEKVELNITKKINKIDTIFIVVWQYVYVYTWSRESIILISLQYNPVQCFPLQTLQYMTTPQWFIDRAIRIGRGGRNRMVMWPLQPCTAASPAQYFESQRRTRSWEDLNFAKFCSSTLRMSLLYIRSELKISSPRSLLDTNFPISPWWKLQLVADSKYISPSTTLQFCKSLGMYTSPFCILLHTIRNIMLYIRMQLCDRNSPFQFSPP